MECASPLQDITPESEEPSLGDVTSGERKHATVMFSDLSGYTAMTEKLDPEEVKNLMGDIFKKAETVVKKYSGTVERFFGDEVMILFGVPKAHEDDPVRAIHAAIEIHKLVDDLSPAFEKAHQTPLKMHTGINTGLVITGDEYIGKGRHGLTGDTINLAKRLTSLAAPGEIIIGPGTYKTASHHFSFEQLSPIRLKGKADKIQPFKVASTIKKTKPGREHSGVRSEMIGRETETRVFMEALDRLKAGKGSVLCVSGFAGCGKSRFVEEIKASADIQWIQGFSYPYTKNIPYFPLLTLFDDLFGIKDGDPPEKINSKIGKNIESLLPGREDITQYIGSLFSLSHESVDTVSPEFWKSKMFDSVLEIIEAVSKQQPTVICFEDVHWADPSFIELIHHIQGKSDFPMLYLYIYRPVISLFSQEQIKNMKMPFREIRIEDLSVSDSQLMVVSLLKSTQIPNGLKKFVETKTQGNPFYLEEMINSLIESGVLKKDQNRWVLERDITESDISSSIHGVISARIDRLEQKSRRILQEAAVIGRSFYFEIINRITRIKEDINTCLDTLQGYDLIKPGKSSIDVEYMFKHALTQEVVYNGLLKAERQVIHEEIGRVIEQIFKERLPEFYETLAHHYAKGKSIHKAVDYLIKSGEKSIRRYAIDESHGYFSQAYELMQDLGETTTRDCEIKLDLVTRWAIVFYYEGNYKKLDDILRINEHLLSKVNNEEFKGMFLNWQGNVFWVRGQYTSARDNLLKAYKIGETIQSNRVLGYTATWLSWVYSDLGQYEKGIKFAKNAIDISTKIKDDHYLYFKPEAGIAANYFFSGNGKGGIETGDRLIEYGNKYSQVRSQGMGYIFKACGYINTGDIDQAVALSKKAVSIAGDPFYKLGFSTILAMAYLQNDEIKKAKEVSKSFLKFSDRFGCENYGALHQLVLGIALIDEGRINKGYNLLKIYEQRLKDQERLSGLILAWLFLGKVFSLIALKKKKVSVLTMLKNIGFIIKHVPSAEKTAVEYFSRVIELAEEIKANGMAAQAHLELGLLYKGKKKTQKAKTHLKTAISIFETIGSDIYLEQARKEIYSL